MVVLRGNVREGLSKARSFIVSRRRELAILATIFVLAAVPNAVFVLSRPSPMTQQVPQLVADENLYFRVAQATLGVIEGETEVGEAVEALSGRSPLYSLFLALIYGVWDNSHMTVAIVQALMNASTCVLIYLVGKRIFGFRPALVAAGSAILYIPFIEATGNLLRETLGSFLLALTVLFLTEASTTLSRRALLLGGFFLGLSILCDPAAQFLSFVLLIVPVVVVWRRRSWRYLLQLVAVFSLGLALTVGPWMMLTKATLGQPLLSTSRPGGAGRGGFLNKIDTDGWKTKTFDGAMVREARRLLTQSGAEVTLEDITRALHTPSFFFQVAINVIRSIPLPVLVSVPVKNFYRLWTFPWNRYRYSLVLTYPQQVIFHRAIVCMALLGMPLCLARRWKRSVVMIAVLAYYSLIWAVQSTEVRHNMSLMPYLMIMAGGALEFLASAAKGVRTSLHRRRIPIALGIFLGFCLLSMAASLPLWSLALRGISPLSIYYVIILVRNGLLLSLVPLLYLLARIRLDRKAACLVSISPIVLLLIGYNVEALTSKTWHGWTVRLSEPGQRIRQEITLPQDLALSWWSEGKVLIDMHGGSDKGYDLVVEVNGERVMEYHNGLQVAADWWGHSHEFYPSRLEAQGREPEDLRQWFAIPVDLSLLTDTDRVVIDVYLVGEAMGSGSYVDIYGDYAWTEDRIYEGPCFAVTPWEARWQTSIYKYSYDDDFRLACEEQLRSYESSSTYHDGVRWSHDDLSEGFGMQSGEFRIRLQLERERIVVRL